MANNKYERMVAEVTERYNKMTVAELRKEAVGFGIKGAKQYKRPELVRKVIDSAVQFHKDRIEAEEAKQAKRYKAIKLDDKQTIEEIANDIVTRGFAKETDPYKVNRKVLILVMKKLHCPRWYRTYDKPTMLAMIFERLSKSEKEE